MFIGGGSGSVAGGIKVATFALLALVVWAELRGEPDVSAFGRTVPPAARADGAVQGRRRGRRHGRQGLRRRGHPAGAGRHSPLGGPRRRRDRRPGGDERHRVLAPALRGHVGVRHADLPAGGTPLLDDAGRAILIALMFIGRVGPVALGAALLLRERPRLYAYPEERPLIG